MQKIDFGDGFMKNIKCYKCGKVIGHLEQPSEYLKEMGFSFLRVYNNNFGGLRNIKQGKKIIYSNAQLCKDCINLKY